MLVTSTLQVMIHARMVRSKNIEKTHLSGRPDPLLSKITLLESNPPRRLEHISTLVMGPEAKESKSLLPK